MKENTRNWWKNPQTIYDISVFVVALIAVIFTIIDAFNIKEVVFFSDNIPGITLSLIALIVISGVIERRIVLRRLEDSIQTFQIGPYKGVSKVYSNRNQLPPFSDMVKDAGEEIFVAGINLGFIALYQLSTLQKKAESGCNIKLLMVDPNSSDSPNSVIEALKRTISPTLDKLLSSNIERLNFWVSKLTQKTKNHIDIRVTQSIPFSSVTFVDKSTSSGKLYLGVFAPKMEDAGALFLLIEGNTGGETYQDYVKAYERIWKEARSVIA